MPKTTTKPRNLSSIDRLERYRADATSNNFPQSPDSAKNGKVSGGQNVDPAAEPAPDASPQTHPAPSLAAGNPADQPADLPPVPAAISFRDAANGGKESELATSSDAAELFTTAISHLTAFATTTYPSLEPNYSPAPR
jgi:hypothetical protein